MAGGMRGEMRIAALLLPTVPWLFVLDLTRFEDAHTRMQLAFGIP